MAWILPTLFSLILIFSNSTFAAPPTFSYQGRILGINGQGLEYGNVSFEFTVTSPDGSCVLYKEQRDGIDMRNSKGVFDTPIGSGIKSYPAAPSFTLLDAFNNSSPLTCFGGSTYTPAFDDTRRLRVSFYDGAGWRVITPDSIIRSVPYAGFAGNAAKFAGKPVTDFVLQSVMPSATCGANEVITFNGTKFVCIADQTSGGGGGSPTGSAGGDLTGTYPNPTIAASAINSSKIQDGTIATVDLASGTGAGQVFRFDGSVWQHTKLQYTDLVNGTGGSPWPTGSCSAGQYITWVSVLDGFTCSSLTSAAVTTALGFTPANQARTITAGTGLTGGGNLSADRTLNVDVGTGANQIPQLDSSGKLAASVIPSSVTNAQWTVSGSDVYRPSGKVGIGTNTPYGLLDVRGATPQILISDSDNAKGSNANGSLEFKDQYNVSLGDIGYFGTRDMFIRNADQGLNFGTGGNDGQMFINAAGNVGVGTTSPNERLDVNGKVKATEFCIGASCLTSWSAAATPGGATTQVQFNNSGAFAGSANFVWDNTNRRLGINSTPVAALDAVSTATGTSVSGRFASNPGGAGAGNLNALVLDNTNGASNFKSEIKFRSNGSEKWSLGVDPAGAGEQTFYLWDAVASKRRMTIDSGGRIGIGTDYPSDKLTVADGRLAVIANDWNDVLNYVASPSASPNIYTVRSRGTYTAPTYAQNNDIMGSFQMRNHNSNFGAGMMSVATENHSASNAGANLMFTVVPNGAAAYAEAMTIASTGYVGIGTSSPTNMLNINSSGFNPASNVNSAIMTGPPGGTSFGGGVLMKDGTYYAGMWTNGNGASLILGAGGTSGGFGGSSLVSISQTGVVNAPGGFTQTSDIRLKTNIEKLNSADALEKITSLQGIYYDWKDQKKNGAGHEVGLIAQDVEKAFPEAVKKNDQGFLAVSYANLIAPVIESIKEILKITDAQSREIASVKAENAELKKENHEMKARLDKIEKMLSEQHK